MSLLQDWRDMAYSQETDKAQLQKFWTKYFVIEKGIYEKLLVNPDEVVRGTVKELADKFGVDVMTMVGFLDGINDSLKVQNPIEEMDENTEVNLGFDNYYIRIWWMQKLTGCIICRCGMKFLQRKRRNLCIWSRRNQVQS